MPFWSGARLRKELAGSNIIEKYYADNIDCSAYTLTLGPEYFITPDFTTKPNASLKRFLPTGQWQNVSGATKKLGQGTLAIPPGQFAFLLTEENIKLPYNVVGFISIKTKVKWSGLINVSGFHVDPGFDGRLIFSVYNAGPSPIHLERGQKLFLLWLADLDDSAKVADARREKYPQRSIPVGLISKVDRPIHSLQQLSNKIEDLESQLKLFRTVAAILAALATLAFALWRAVGD